jgi:hypothetical protein
MTLEQNTTTLLTEGSVQSILIFKGCDRGGDATDGPCPHDGNKWAACGSRQRRPKPSVMVGRVAHLRRHLSATAASHRRYQSGVDFARYAHIPRPICPWHLDTGSICRDLRLPYRGSCPPWCGNLVPVPGAVNHGSGVPLACVQTRLRRGRRHRYQVDMILYMIEGSGEPVPRALAGPPPAGSSSDVQFPTQPGRKLVR